MTKINTPLLALLTMSLLSCEKDIAPFSEQIRIGLNACEQRRESSETFRLCFNTIVQDSRCPINANCTWQGVAVARFTLHLKDGQHTLELATTEVMPNTTRDTTINGFTVTLKDLSPYPGGATDETPVAEVLIEHR